MVGIFPLGPHHDYLQYIHHIHLMQMQSKPGYWPWKKDQSSWEMPWTEGWVFKISTLPHWFRSLQPHGFLQRIIFFSKSHSWPKYLHGRWYSDLRWREGYNIIRPWNVQNCFVWTLLSNKFVIPLPDDTYWLAKLFDISIWKLISQGVTNHISKEYEFLCFFPYSDSFQDL